MARHHALGRSEALGWVRPRCRRPSAVRRRPSAARRRGGWASTAYSSVAGAGEDLLRLLLLGRRAEAAELAQLAEDLAAEAAQLAAAAEAAGTAEAEAAAVAAPPASPDHGRPKDSSGCSASHVRPASVSS